MSLLLCAAILLTEYFVCAGLLAIVIVPSYESATILPFPSSQHHSGFDPRVESHVRVHFPCGMNFVFQSISVLF